MTAPTDLVLTELKDRVLTLRIHRPDKKNALLQVMYGALADHISAAAKDPQVRALLITGTPDCFTAGNDMQDFLSQTAPMGETETVRFMHALWNFPKAVVAAINGVSIGVGTTLLLHCDLAYAGAGARFQMPFVNIGICPEYCSSFLFPVSLGHRRAAELLLLGDMFNAQKALELGLINEVVADADVYAHALAKAQRLAAQPPDTLRSAKRLMRQALEQPMREAFDREIATLTRELAGPEAKEAMSAFMQKRKPDFSKFN